MPRVRVGVTNTRKKFDAAAESVPSFHHAHCPLHPVPRILSGHTEGIQYPDTDIQVIPANTGIPVLTLSQPIGIPKTLGTLPGASGAQLSGKLIHDPPPNPHERPLAIISAASLILSTNPSSKAIFTSSPLLLTSNIEPEYPILLVSTSLSLALVRSWIDLFSTLSGMPL